MFQLSGYYCLYLYTHQSACMFLHTYAYSCICMCIYIYIFIHMFTYIYVSYVHMYVYAHSSDVRVSLEGSAESHGYQRGAVGGTKSEYCGGLSKHISH